MKYFSKKNQAGQTIIETLAAVFILTMGITAATGLAIYALSASSNITQQIVATALAREGIEAFKNMRDTNWLKSTIATNCYNFLSGSNNGKCYPEWLNPSGNAGYDIRQAGANKSTRLILDPNLNKYWQYKDDNTTGGKWGLDFRSDIDSPSFTGYYSMSDVINGVSNGNSGFYRKITITEDSTTQPYNRTNFQRLKIVSRVWWSETKKCPKLDDWDESVGKIPKASCRVELQEYLTNWKNY